LLYKIRKKDALKAGLGENFERSLYPLLLFPLILLKINFWLFLASLALFFYSPKLLALYLAKERRKRIREELPVVCAQLSWIVDLVPLQRALESFKDGEIGILFSRILKSYEGGKEIKKCFEENALFPELEELFDALLFAYRTGRGSKVLKDLSDRLRNEIVREMRMKSARLQLFTVVYTIFAAVLPSLAASTTYIFNSSKLMLLSSLASALMVLGWKILD